MRLTIAEARKLVKEFRRAGMNIIGWGLAVIGATLVGFGFGKTPDWIWTPFAVFFGAGFLYAIYDDNRKARRKRRKNDEKTTRP